VLVYILYVDESGVEDGGGGTDHFVLLGLAIRADRWKEHDRDLEAIKGEFRLEGIEIHTAWMARRYVAQEKVDGLPLLDSGGRVAAARKERAAHAGVLGIQGAPEKLKAYRRYCRATEPYLHLLRSERLSCLDRLASQIGQWEDARIFAEAVAKADFVNRRGLTLYETAFEQVLTRFQSFLERRHATGIVVHDNNEKVAARLTHMAREFHRFGTFWKKIHNIVETPLFVDSGLTAMIQMADLAAYALRRKIENGEEELWGKFEQRVDRTRGKLVGLRHFTGARRCSCCICRAHGRR